MKRRALALLCAGILAVGMLAGCGGSSDKKDSSAKTEDTKKEAKSDGTFTVALNYMHLWSQVQPVMTRPLWFVRSLNHYL